VRAATILASALSIDNALERLDIDFSFCGKAPEITLKALEVNIADS
jgi:hypothetical protein